MDKREYWFWLNNIEGIGNIKIRRLLEFYGDAENIYKAKENELVKIPGLSEKDIFNIFDEQNKKIINSKYDKYNKDKVAFVFPWEADYPDKLNELYDKPQILYYIGRSPNKNIKSVAIIGARNCSEYGRKMAKEIAYELSRKSVDIISGLAMGIDSEAHEGAVMAGGTTYAVLAGGVNKCYPASNYNLYVDIIRHGGIISEYPPDTNTVPGMFPLRNRIVSGLADVVVVVEAGAKSGSLITVNHALEQNKTVYAVPGRMVDKMSIGCNRLIAEGAGILTSIDVLFEELGIECLEKEKEEKNNMGLASDEKMLYSLLLDFIPRSLDSIVEDTKAPVGVVLTALLGLELKGFIKEISKNFYVRIR